MSLTFHFLKGRDLSLSWMVVFLFLSPVSRVQDEVDQAALSAEWKYLTRERAVLMSCYHPPKQKTSGFCFRV